MIFTVEVKEEAARALCAHRDWEYGVAAVENLINALVRGEIANALISVEQSIALRAVAETVQTKMVDAFSVTHTPMDDDPIVEVTPSEEETVPDTPPE